MIVKIGFISFEEGSDDIYPLPTLAIGWYKSPTGKGTGFGIGLKFMKLIFAIRFMFPPVTQLPLKKNNDAHI